MDCWETRKKKQPNIEQCNKNKIHTEVCKSPDLIIDYESGAEQQTMITNMTLQLFMTNKLKINRDKSANKILHEYIDLNNKQNEPSVCETKYLHNDYGKNNEETTNDICNCLRPNQNEPTTNKAKSDWLQSTTTTRMSSA